MILITIPTPDVTIEKQDAPEQSNIYGFTDFHLIPKDKGGWQSKEVTSENKKTF